MSFRRGSLEYFVAVAEEGQMTRAARRLEVAQPALSQAIAQLEADLGLRLLDRHARGVTLTPAGMAIYEKARVAVEANREAVQTAQSLARSQLGTIEFGFMGYPPGVDSPEPLEAFAAAYPRIEIHYRELAFPAGATSMWLADVDIAACPRPPADEKVWTVPWREEPRVILMPAHHRLADRPQLTLEDVIDETFIGFDPGVDRDWAGFWTLDDHRGSPPAHVTGDRTAHPQEVVAALSMSDALMAIPASLVSVTANQQSGLTAVPLLGCAPALIVLAGHRGRENPLIDALLSFPATSARGGPAREPGRPPAL